MVDLATTPRLRLPLLRLGLVVYHSKSWEGSLTLSIWTCIVISFRTCYSLLCLTLMCCYVALFINKSGIGLIQSMDFGLNFNGYNWTGYHLDMDIKWALGPKYWTGFGPDDWIIQCPLDMHRSPAPVPSSVKKSSRSPPCRGRGGPQTCTPFIPLPAPAQEARNTPPWPK
jgi:hypothetical protein